MDPSHSFESGPPPTDAGDQPTSRPPPALQHAIQEESPLLPQARKGSTALIGAEFAAPWRWPVVASVFAGWSLIAGSLFFFPPDSAVHVLLAISSVPSFLVAVWRFLAARRFRVRFTEQGVETTGPRETLAYREIMEVYAPDQAASPESFDIYLLHAYGCLHIPKKIGAPARAILGFLQSQHLAERDNPAVPAALQGYLSNTTRTHGSANVYVYRTELSLQNREPSRLGETVTGWMFGGGFAISMLFTMTSVFIQGDKPFDKLPDYVMVLFGVLMTIVLVGAFGYVFFITRRWLAETLLSLKTMVGWHTESALIISPTGVAVLHGGKRIVVDWQELRLGSPAGIVLPDDQAAPCIEIWRDRTRIKLRDHFHWPVRHAIDRIRAYLA